MSETPFCDRVASALALGPGNTFQDRDSWEKTARAMERELEEAKRSLSDGRWRCARTDRPPENRYVLIWYRASYPGWRVSIGEVSCGHWRPEGGNGNFDDDITHWMPLPEPPK